MLAPLRYLIRLLNRWSRQQEDALSRMLGAKTAGRRMSGYTKSERLDARFLLLAAAPFLPLMVSDELGWPRGLFWYATLWAGLAWSALVFGFGLLGYIRAILGAVRRQR